MAASQALTTDVIFDADKTLKWHSPDPTVEYGFCSICGSSLFWRATNEPRLVSICAGALDGPTGLQTVEAWWVAEASDYHERPRGITEHKYE